VPRVLYDNASGGTLALKAIDGAGPSNIAATVPNLIGFDKHEAWDESLLDVR